MSLLDAYESARPTDPQLAREFDAWFIGSLAGILEGHPGGRLAWERALAGAERLAR